MLLERDDLLGAAESAMRALGAGAPAILVVEGPAGLGKTAFLLALRQRLAGDVRVLGARPAQHETDYAFGVVRQLLAPVLAAPDAPGWSVAAAPALKALGSQPGDAEGPAARRAAAGTPPHPVAIDDGVWRLVADLAAAGPLALLVDDAHWADTASLRALGHVARRLEGLPVGLVVAARPGEPGSAADLLDVIRMDPRTQVLRLPPLSPDASLVLAGGDAALASAAHASTGGNPLYLHELLASVDGRGAEAVDGATPATIARHVIRRAAALGEDALALAEAMAVTGDTTPLAHAAAVAGIGVGDARILAHGLVGSTVLAGADPVRFAHPVVLSAVRAAVAPEREDALLRRAVAVLRDAGAPAEQLAAYLLQLAPGAGADVAPLRAAAAAALGRGAPDAARTYLARALTEPPPPAERPFVLHELGTAEQLLADGASDAHLAQAAELAPDPTARAQWTVQRAGALAFGGRVPDAVVLLEAALDAGWAGDGDARDLLRAHLLGMAWGSADGSARAPEILADFAANPPRLPAIGRFVAGMRAGRMDSPADESAALAEAAWDEGDDPAAFFARIMAAGALIYTDRFARAQERLDRLLDQSRSAANLIDLKAVRVMLGELAYAQGELTHCLVHAEAGMLPSTAPASGTQAYVTAVRVRAELELGRVEAAVASLDGAGLEPWLPTSHAHFFLRTAQGRVRLAQGRAQEAIDAFAAARRCLARFSGTVWSPLGFDGLSEEPAALVSCGRVAEARALVADGLARLDVSPPRGQALTLRAAALLELAAPADTGARDATAPARGGGPARRRDATVPAGGGGPVEWLEAAARRLDGVGARLELARTLVDLGTALRHDRRRADAREPLGRALDLARDCGAEPLAARAREELAATGARPRRDRLSTGRDALTPSEARLARLAAQGRTNREIAQELFLSRKTVEMHLGRAYRKLGIQRRTELAAALGDPGEDA